jgi:hypothetical protein
MASIDKRPDGRYQARWRAGPQKTRHFDRKGDADRFLDVIRGDIAHALYVDPAAAARCSRSTPNSGESGRSTAPRQRPSARHTSASTPTPLSGAGRSAPSGGARSRRGSRS